MFSQLRQTCICNIRLPWSFDFLLLVSFNIRLFSLQMCTYTTDEMFQRIKFFFRVTISLNWNSFRETFFMTFVMPMRYRQPFQERAQCRRDWKRRGSTPLQRTHYENSIRIRNKKREKTRRKTDQCRMQACQTCRPTQVHPASLRSMRTRYAKLSYRQWSTIFIHQVEEFVSSFLVSAMKLQMPSSWQPY